MPMTDDEIQALVVQTVQDYLDSLRQVRINELPPYSVDNDPLDNDDRIPIFRYENGKTTQVLLQQLKAFMVNSSEQVIDPDKLGASIIVTATEVEIGTNVFNIPSLNGKQFILRRNKEGALRFAGADKQYEILSSGGFRLLPEENTIQPDDQFELQLADEEGNVQTSVGGGTLFNGLVLIQSSITLNVANHIGKLFQLRPTAAGTVVTLPDLLDVPANTVVVMEAMINCETEVKLKTTGGQFIYFNGASLLELGFRMGDYLMLYPGTDGWYVFAASPSMYNVGMILDGYAIELNEIELKGQQVPISSINRAWSVIQSKYPVVDEATWATPAAYFHNGAWTLSQPAVGQVYETIYNPYRGCFAFDSGQTPGSELVRMPDFTDMFTRTLGTDDTQRYYNEVGGAQDDRNKAHTHTVNTGDTQGQSDNANDRDVMVPSNPGTSKTTSSSGGPESRGKNIALLKKMKI